MQSSEQGGLCPRIHPILHNLTLLLYDISKMSTPVISKSPFLEQVKEANVKRNLLMQVHLENIREGRHFFQGNTADIRQQFFNIKVFATYFCTRPCDYVGKKSYVSADN